jgi:hypothetical protein
MDSDDAVFDEQSDFSIEDVGASPGAKTFRAPLWVTLIALGIGAFGITFGLFELFSPGRTGLLELNVAVPDNEFAAMSWGVRNAALGATLIAAILFRHAGGYIVAFIGALARDGGDLFVALGNDDQGIASYILIVIFIVLEVLCLLALLAKGVKFKLG